MASVFPIRGRPTSEGIISKRISHVLWDGKEESPHGNAGAFAFASSPKSCSIKAWTNCVNVAGDGAGIRISSSKHQRVNVLNFFVYTKANAYNF
jgi:hypothetical protein